MAIRKGTSRSELRPIAGKLLTAVVVFALISACSVKRTAVNILGDALSGGGGAYTSDDDPDLIREALPLRGPH